MAEAGTAAQLDAVTGSDAAAERTDWPSSPWTRVETALVDTARGVRAAYDREFAILDLNLTQALLLSLLAEFGPHTQTQIAERLSLGRAATGKGIDQLEARDLLARNPDPADRRVWKISLTDDGLAMVDRVREIDNLFAAQVRDGITREERQVLAQLLLKIQNNLGL